jgi:phosphotriesterase-related protein
MTGPLANSPTRGRIQTVLGPIDPVEIGMTLMHEHLIWDIRPPTMRSGDQGPSIDMCNCWRINYGRLKIPRNLVSDSVETAVSELAEMIEAGGRTIVELSSGGLKPDPEALVRIARQSGAQIVMGCGHYVQDYQDPANHERRVDDFAEEMVKQIEIGAWGTSIRAGIIGEIGCQSPWTELERRVMHGAILAQVATGAALNVHPGRHADQPQEVVDFAKSRGAATDRIIVSHIDRTIFDEERLFRLADSGCVLEFDLFGQETTYYSWNPAVDMPNDGVRLRWLRALIDRGHLDQIVISHDICYLSRLSRYGGHGYGHIYQNVLPLMRERGFSSAEVNAIMVHTPRRLLTIGN